MDEEIRKQNKFSRIKYNEAKMGAYYTDPFHCKLIHQFLEFPEKDEVCCLDPSIGDAVAILEVTEKLEEKDNIKIFGVEINQDSCQMLKEETKVDYLLQADFLEDVVISHNSFSFCFMNPPYGGLENEREEITFLKKVTPYLTKEAVIVLVIPKYILKESEFINYWCTHYDTNLLYQFLEEEYHKFKQIVIIGRKRSEKMNVKKRDEIIESYFIKKCEGIEEIPINYTGEKVIVSSSKKDRIVKFTTTEFNPKNVISVLKTSPLHQLIRDKIKIEEYGGVVEIGRPPVMPKNSHLYLLSTCGFGQGFVGSEENGDLHLQRGVVKRSKIGEYVSSGDEEENLVYLETEKSSVAYKIVEADGTLHELM